MLRFSLAVIGVLGVSLAILWMSGLLTWSGEETSTHSSAQAQDSRGGSRLTQPYRADVPTPVNALTVTPTILLDPIVITDTTLAPAEEAEVPSRVDGQLVQLYVRPGSQLIRGDLIAQLDDSLIQLEMETAKVRAESTAEIEVAKLVRDYWDLEYRKAQEVNRSVPNAVAVLEVEKNRVQRDRYQFEWVASVEKNRIARHEYEQKRRQWELHQIRSPISGEIVRVYKRPGEGVRAGETVVRIANFDRLYVEGAIPLPLRHMVRPGMRVLVEPERQQGCLKELRGHTAAVTGLVPTPDGRWLISSGEDGRLVFWDWQYAAQRPLELRDEKFSREYGCVACSPVLEEAKDGMSYTIFSGCADGRIRVWKVAVSPQGRVVKHALNVMSEGSAMHRTAIRCLAISPDGKLIASGSEDGEILVTDLASRQVLLKLRDPQAAREPAHRAAVTSLSFLPQGDILSASQDRSLARWRLGQDEKGQWVSELLWRIEGRTADVAQLGISRDGRRALFENGEELRVLDLTDGQSLAVISSRRSGHFRAIAIFSPDGRQVLTTTAGGRLHLWNVPPTLEESAWLRLAYHKGFRYHTPLVSGAWAASLTPQGLLTVPFSFHLAQSPPSQAPTLADSEASVESLATAPAYSSTQIPELWPIDARELRLLSMNDPSSVTCAAFSPDGRFCFTGGTDKVIRVWPTPSLDEVIRPLEGILVHVGQQVESGGGLVRIRAEIDNPRLRPARLESGVRVTLTVLPELRP
ncbi:MAG: HlyD family efflux transporter periplasmic adaptor subunit [Gemmatales bacterium]|nr:HlyD family efflux transporter periplasmic adaptor subunit [Gemmatales bacterium]